MSKEYLLGRCSESALSIPAESNAVSSRHARLTIGDEGQWWLEDLDSTNGTFVRDDTGDFHRVFRKRITPETVVRLGDRAQGHIFMAYRVGQPKADYMREFQALRKLMDAQIQAEQSQEHRMTIYGWIAKLSGLAALGILSLIKESSLDPTPRYFIIAGTPAVVGLMFQKSISQAKKLRKRREKLFICPKCFRPLSEREVEQGKCDKCKAQ